MKFLNILGFIGSVSSIIALLYAWYINKKIRSIIEERNKIINAYNIDDIFQIADKIKENSEYIYNELHKYKNDHNDKTYEQIIGVVNEVKDNANIVKNKVSITTSILQQYLITSR